MFCPNCAAEERQRSQYCRVCGTDLRAVRAGLERPDTVVASATGAREEIGRAIAERIRAVQGAKDLKKITEEVLPEITKFLESPEEQRLRRIRAGVVCSSIGFGAAIMFSLIFSVAREERLLFPAGLGLVLFFIGLGLIINGYLFTVVDQAAPEPGQIDSPTAFRSGYLESSPDTARELNPAIPTIDSITEHTTHHLPQAGRANDA